MDAPTSNRAARSETFRSAAVPKGDCEPQSRLYGITNSGAVSRLFNTWIVGIDTIRFLTISLRHLMIFRYTILYVDNVTESMDFFARAFGFEQRFIHESGDYGELSTGETKLAFSSTELMKQLNKNPRAPSPASPTFEIAFESDNVATDLARAIDAGATLVQEVRDEPWGQTTSYVTDPNGYLIEICSTVQLPTPG